MRRVFALFAALAFVAVACSNTTESEAARAGADTTIDWESCGQIECATFAVPLDYAKPDGDTIELSLIRIKARDQGRRLGVLMANPGGPGASANDFMRVWGSLLSGEIRDRFDLVSFDPRGVGESSPVVCHDNLQELVAVDPDPDTEAEWQAAKAESKTFADNCAEKYAGVLPFLGTNNVARDMDAIRAALGEEKLNYVGYSYGTSIGAVYADMFPTRIRSMVLDGGTDLLMFGDESGLGTPVEDMTSLAAVGQLPIAHRHVACIGFGIDAHHGVCHSHFLENVAALERDGAYHGAFSVSRHTQEGALYLRAVAHAAQAHEGHASIVNGSIAAALGGEFGDVHEPVGEDALGDRGVAVGEGEQRHELRMHLTRPRPATEGGQRLLIDRHDEHLLMRWRIKPRNR